MKTALEWFELLPADIREKAVKNSVRNTLCDSLADAVSSFFWYASPEGHDYWSVVWGRAEAGEFDVPQPRLSGSTDPMPVADALWRDGIERRLAALEQKLK